MKRKAKQMLPIYPLPIFRKMSEDEFYALPPKRPGWLSRLFRRRPREAAQPNAATAERQPS